MCQDHSVGAVGFEVTHKPTQRRMQLEEVGLLTVDTGKIVREESFYGEG